MHCEVTGMDTVRLDDHHLNTLAPLPPLVALQSLVFKPPCFRIWPPLNKGLLSGLRLPVLRRLHILEGYIGHQPIHELLRFIERSGCRESLGELHVIDSGLQESMYRRAFGESMAEIGFDFQDGRPVGRGDDDDDDNDDSEEGERSASEDDGGGHDDYEEDYEVGEDDDEDEGEAEDNPYWWAAQGGGYSGEES
ncbi:hypothetical protein C8R46DRAFT_1057347 [Mycena filopes]|nr:hypothetical protein C8R46DRAFT_1057347 [Mycena filopes]